MSQHDDDVAMGMAAATEQASTDQITTIEDLYETKDAVDSTATDEDTAQCAEHTVDGSTQQTHFSNCLSSSDVQRSAHPPNMDTETLSSKDFHTRVQDSVWNVAFNVGMSSRASFDMLHLLRTRLRYQSPLDALNDELDVRPKVRLDRGPKDTVKWYKYNGWFYGTDNCGRVTRAFGYADPFSADDTGESTSTPAGDIAIHYVRQYGDKQDQAGHIRARSLGGGVSILNIMPQCANSNAAAWSPWRRAEVFAESALGACKAVAKRTAPSSMDPIDPVYQQIVHQQTKACRLAISIFLFYDSGCGLRPRNGYYVVDGSNLPNHASLKKYKERAAWKWSNICEHIGRMEVE